MSESLIECQRCHNLRHVSNYYVFVTDGKQYRSKHCKPCGRQLAKESAAKPIAARGGYTIKPPIRKDKDGMTGVERRAHWATYKAKRGCADCGEMDWRILEFDHLPGHEKRFNIGEAVRRTGTYTDAEVAAEVEKCDVVCRRCHQQRTISRRRYPESYFTNDEGAA